MSINQFLEKIKPLYIPLLILVIASVFFAFGRLSSLKEKETPLKIEYVAEANTGAVISTTLASTSTPAAPVAQVPAGDGSVIGSKSGKKYYFPWCGTVKRIKPENQVHFASIAAAKAAGFTPGGNCKGIN